MSIRHSHWILSIFTLALCAGCTTSTAVDHAAQSRGQSPRYDADSQRKSPPANFAGRVVAVEDGDMIVVLDDANRTYKIRLHGIDAPEGGQAFEIGLVRVLVRWFLETRSRSNGLSVIGDRYRRLVGKVLSDGSDIFLQQIRAGMA